MNSNETNIDYWEILIANPSPSYKEVFYAEKEFLRRKIKLNSSVLDVGCGDGRIISFFKDIPKEIVGIDLDAIAVEHASRNLPEAKIKIIQASAFELPFEDKYFDHAILMMTLVNFSENKISSLLEMKRVIKDDGSIIISVYSDEAFEERRSMYEKIGVPVEKIDGTTFIFSEKIGAHISEQFSYDEFESLCNQVDLNISDYKKTKIAHIFELTKKN